MSLGRRSYLRRVRVSTLRLTPCQRQQIELLNSVILEREKLEGSIKDGYPTKSDKRRIQLELRDFQLLQRKIDRILNGMSDTRITGMKNTPKKEMERQYDRVRWAAIHKLEALEYLKTQDICLAEGKEPSRLVYMPDKKDKKEIGLRGMLKEHGFLYDKTRGFLKSGDTLTLRKPINLSPSLPPKRKEKSMAHVTGSGARHSGAI